jgi:hypothetical protein
MMCDVGVVEMDVDVMLKGQNDETPPGYRRRGERLRCGLFHLHLGFVKRILVS